MKSNLQATIDWYNEHAEEYAGKVKSKFHRDDLKQFKKYLPEQAHVLDAGCAAGRDSQLLQAMGLKVVGVDLSQKLIEIARKENSNIKFVEANLLKLPFSKESFDGIWASASLVHLEAKAQVKQALSEFNRVLVSDGIVYLCVQNRLGHKSGWVSDDHSVEGRFFQFLNLLEIESLVKESGLKIIDSFERQSTRPGIVWSVVYAQKET